jgi:hypothetical protein
VTDEGTAQFSLDIAGAYPEEAGLQSWIRTIRLQRGEQVEIGDRYKLGAPADEIVLSLLTPAAPRLNEPGHISFVVSPLPGDRLSGVGHLTYDSQRFTVRILELPITDQRLRQVWGTRLSRVLLTAHRPAREDAWAFQIRSKE